MLDSFANPMGAVRTAGTAISHGDSAAMRIAGSEIEWLSLSTMADLNDFTPLRIGDCRFDPRSHELECNGQLTRLPRKQSLLLWELARAAPEVLSRQALIDRVWDRGMVEEAVLSRAVAELRRALDDDPRAPRYIETIPKSGYRLCAPVQAWSAKASAPEVAVTATSQSLSRSQLNRVPFLALPSWIQWLFALMIVVAGGSLLSQWPKTPRAPAEEQASLDIADLARIRPLTSDPGFEYRADLSADGQWLVYTQSERDGGPSRLWFQDIDGKHKELLTPPGQHEFRPALSPDGKQIAFLRSVHATCELHLRSTTSTDSRKLADCSADIGSPAWSADGRSLVFTAPAEPGFAAGLSVIDLSQGKVTALTRPSMAAGPDRDAEWVPGRQQISFARGYDGEQWLLKLDLANPQAEPVRLFDAGRLQGHAWRADGAQLLVASDAPGYRTLVLLEANGTLQFALNTRGAQFPSWARNGELVFEQAMYDANIERLDLSDATATSKPIITSTRYDASPVISPDGAALVFVSTREDFEHIYLADRDGNHARRLGFADGSRWSRPSFSPDGRFVIATGYDANNVDWIYRFDRVREQSERLDALGDHASGARYRADGKGFVYMRRNTEGARSLWRIELEPGQTPVAIADTEGVEHFEWAGPDLLLKRRHHAGFVRLRGPDYVQQSVLFADLEPISAGAWVVSSDQLFVVVREAGKNVLKRADLDSQRIDTVARDVDADAVGPALAMDRDQQTLWFARTASMQIDLMRLPATRAAQRGAAD